jgi:hypothetical protein
MDLKALQERVSILEVRSTTPSAMPRMMSSVMPDQRSLRRLRRMQAIQHRIQIPIGV